MAAKRCGHRPNKMLVAKDEMVDRIKSAVEAKHTHADIDPDFVIIARTDALASEGIESAWEYNYIYLYAHISYTYRYIIVTMQTFGL